jgi:ketosteroid isomerase-like protein
MEHPSDVVRAAYAALGDKDLAAFIALCADDVVLTQDPRLPWGGRHVGHDGVETFALALVGAIDSAVTPEALFDAGERVIQYGRTAGTARATGRTFDIPECHVWRVVDGRVASIEFYIDSEPMLSALGTAERRD